MKQGKFNIIIGVQAGSEAKGKLSAFLVEKFKIKHIVMAASPNGSHTASDWSGKKYITHHLPAGAIIGEDISIYLGPSSVIMPEMFLQELGVLGINQARVFIHPRATVITRSHIIAGNGINQGVDAARAEKLMRKNVIFVDSIPKLKPMIDDTIWMINDLLQRGVPILCEMTQGFDLDLEHSIDFESSTSKMINPAMAMAEAGVSPKWIGDVYGVLRPLLPLPSAKSWARFELFCQICRPDFLCLQFANQLDEEDYGRSGNYMGLSNVTRSFIGELEDKSKTKVAYVGTGPDRGHMIDVGVDE